MRIAIDFELVNTREGRINPQARDAIKAWLAAGHTVEIYSTSAYLSASDVAEYMRTHGFAGAKNLLGVGAPRWDVIAGNGTLDGSSWTSIRSGVERIGRAQDARRDAKARKSAKTHAEIVDRMRDDAVRLSARLDKKYGGLDNWVR